MFIINHQTFLELIVGNVQPPPGPPPGGASGGSGQYLGSALQVRPEDLADTEQVCHRKSLFKYEKKVFDKMQLQSKFGKLLLLEDSNVYIKNWHSLLDYVMSANFSGTAA
jgi:hypothetical protein